MRTQHFIKKKKIEIFMFFFIKDILSFLERKEGRTLPFFIYNLGKGETLFQLIIWGIIANCLIV
jgi:hypothetical protein